MNQVGFPELPKCDDEYSAVPYEQQFKEIISFLKGLHKLDQLGKPLKTDIYFTLEIQCNKNGFSYSTTIIGDIFEHVSDARENVYMKAVELLRKKYFVELNERSEAIRNKSFE